MSEFYAGYNLFAGSDSDVSDSSLPFFLPTGFKAGDEVAAENVNPGVQDHVGALFLPSLAGGLGIVYNIPGKTELSFNPTVLGRIFTGRLEWWNDTLIQMLNPGVALPQSKIKVVGRSGESGSTKVFTNFLSKYSDIQVSSSPVWYLGMFV
jgi:phosphate transport system substrate-binding protein